MHKPINTPPRGITWLEILVLLALAAILWSLAIPAVGPGLSNSPVTQTLSNMRQLQVATQQMDIDHAKTGNPVRWTCSNTTPLTVDQWKNAISPEYFSERELKKFLTVTFGRPLSGTKTNDEGFNVFAVTDSDPGDTLLFATKNWHGPNAKELSGELYGRKAFVVFTKNSGAVLQSKQTTNLSKIGGGGMHNYLPLK